jgi:uncharacterized protein YlzI (FlbEa/FlbD family)
MKKMNWFLVAVGCVFSLIVSSTSCAYAQEDREAGYAVLGVQNDLHTIHISSPPNNKVKGSVYINKEFSTGKVVQTNKTFNGLFRYNSYSNEIECKMQDRILALAPITGSYVLLNGSKYVVKYHPEKSKNVFVMQLTDGKFELFNFYKIKRIKAASDATLLNIDSSDEIKIMDDIFLQEKGKVQRKLPKKKKDISSLLHMETLEYSKKEKLSFRKVDDIVKMFDYNNRLEMK